MQFEMKLEVQYTAIHRLNKSNSTSVCNVNWQHFVMQTGSNLRCNSAAAYAAIHSLNKSNILQ